MQKLVPIKSFINVKNVKVSNPNVLTIVLSVVDVSWKWIIIVRGSTIVLEKKIKNSLCYFVFTLCLWAVMHFLWLVSEFCLENIKACTNYIILDPVFFKCENWTHYARLPPERVNRFEWNFDGVYSALSPFVRDIYRISFLCPPPKYFSHWTYMTLWGIAPLPVQSRNRKSKIAPCSRACWTLYTLQVSCKSTVQFRRRRGINLKKNGI